MKDHKDFERLYRSDPILFHLGFDMFVNNGRVSILAGTDEELRTDASGIVSGYSGRYKIGKIVQLARELAGLSGMELLNLANCCGIRLEDTPVDEPEVCPLCGGSLRYGDHDITDELRTQKWTCEDCGATGKEAYRLVFDCHYDVRDSGGELVVERKQNK